MRSTRLRAPLDIKNGRTQLQPIRTATEMTAHIEILPVRRPYLYQKLSRKATQLRLLGMSYKEIAKTQATVMVLSQIRDIDARGQIKKSRAALFTGLIKKMAHEAHLELNLKVK